MVLEAGIEPARPWAEGFKPSVSTYSTTLGVQRQPLAFIPRSQIAIAIAVILPLLGCETLPEVRTVRIPIPVSCVSQSDLPQRPKILTNQELLSLSDGNLVLKLAQERLELLKFSGEQGAILVNCVR